MRWSLASCLLTGVHLAFSHLIKDLRRDTTVIARNTSDTKLYYADQINDSTYLLNNHDSYVEYPFIYVKLYPELPLALVVDTGVGAGNGAEGTQAQELKDFIEAEIIPNHPVPCSKGQKYKFLVFCTHCHFDHTGGIHAFSDAGAEIVASGFNQSFLALQNRNANFLCSAFGTRLPECDIDRFVADGQRLKHHGGDLGLVVLQTPGHTPDSLALYDEREEWLFVGDTLYQRVRIQPWGETQDVPIILVGQSHWDDYVKSLNKMHKFIDSTEANSNSTIHLSSGHTSSGVIAKTFVSDAITFVQRVVAGVVPVITELTGDKVAPGGTLCDETFVYWQDGGNPLFSFLAPERFEQKFQTA